MATARQGDTEPVGDSRTTWAELRWSARCQAVTSLADLMLRRTRVGLLLPRGGEKVLADVGVVCREELGWDGAWWERSADLAELVCRCYVVSPGTSTVSPAGTASTVTGSGPTGSPSA